MKHVKLFFALFAMLALGVTNAWGAEELYKNALFKAANCTNNSSYTGTVTCTIGNDKWVAQNAANNNGGWDYVKIGAKKSKSSDPDKVTTGTITTNAAYAEAVSKIVVNGQKDRGSFTSKLIIASNSSFTTGKVEITGATSFTNNQIVFTIPSPSANKYYKLEFVCTNTTTSNGVIQVSSVEYYYESSAPEKVLSSIEISGDLTDKTYEEGEELDLAGLTVTAKYDDNSEENVTDNVEWSYTPNPLTKGTTSATITATYEDKTATTTITGLTVNEHIITPGEYELLLNNVFFGTTAGTSVSSFPTSAKQDDITVTLNGGGTKTRTDAGCVRMYQNNTLTFSVPAGYVINSIVFTAGGDWNGSITVNAGTYTDDPKSWAGSAQEVVFSFGAQNRIATATVTYAAAGGTTDPVEPVVPKNLGAKTIAEFLALKNTTDTCVLTGVVANIANTEYGNFDLVDVTGTVYVYGLLTAAGESKQFASMDIAAGDTLTVKAIYNEYNSKPQAKNAIYVSHTKTATPVVPENLGAKTIAEFLELKNTTDTCVLTGVVANIANTEYGNFDLVDATDTVYVYGLLTAAGVSKQFASMDIAAGDTLTVKAIYNEYKGTPQAKNAIYVSHSKLVLTVKVTSENGRVDGLADGGKYVRGAEATLTANPESGYKFVNWTSGETVVSTENPYKFTVTADVVLVANFIKKTISYELNGGEFPTPAVPTQDSLIAAFKDGYNAYFGVSVATTRAIDNFLYAGAAVNDPKCDVSLFMKDDASPWKWLGDYVLAVTNAQIEAGLLENLKELATELMWRQSLTAFFLQQAKLDSNYKGNADFTEAGKPENWGPAYQAAHGVVLPTEPVDAPYTLPTPVKEGYKFVGWYDNAEGTDEPMTVIPADWDGTLYAIWVEIYTITVEAENGTVEGAGNYEHGAEATLTATAAEGYEFTCWTSGKDTVSTANPYKFTVTADVALVANFKEAAPTYDLELVAKDLYSASDEVKTQFEGSNSLNPDMTISVTLFASKYGTYTSTGAEEDEFNAFYAGSQILGELTYSYSDELKSDLVVIIGTITDEEETSTIKVTMYEEYLEPTDVVVLNNLQKNVQKMGWMSNLMLFNAANDTIITISGCDGTYGKYSAWGTFGADELEGKGEWKNDGENDVFVGVLYNADKTKVFQVTATTPAEKIKEYTYELADVSFTLSEASNTLIIEAYAEEPEPVQVYLELAGWTPEQTIYAVGEMCGSIANMDNIEGADVANLTYEVESYLEGKELTITAQVEDATGNTYLLILTGEYDSTTTALDNLNTTVAPVKMIENGQLIIINNGVQYNAQGQVIK